MKKKAIIITLSTSALLLLAAPVFGANGGIKSALGFEGDKFGSTVSELAKSEPGAVAELVSNSEKETEEEAEAKPEKGEMSGKEYGAAVSQWAKNKNKNKSEVQAEEQEQVEVEESAE